MKIHKRGEGGTKTQKGARRYKKRVRRHEDTNIEEGVFGLLLLGLHFEQLYY